jgi:hypothetical protein
VALAVFSGALAGLPPGPATAAVFTQEAVGYGPDGAPLPVTVINPAARADLRIQNYALGSGRTLQIQTNLAVERTPEIASLAAVVRRCYAHLETASGRSISGGVLLYLLQYPERPRYYRFQVDTADTESWTQVRVALLNTGQPLLGPGASPHVTEFVYDTLPHELGHGLLTGTPTVRHDLNGQASQGTRWFIEGVCEKLAKGFAAQEAPAFWREALHARGVHRAFAQPELCAWVWDWGQASALGWSVDSDLYGFALLLVTAWTQDIELPELLALMSARGGDLDGEGLRTLLRETTHAGRSRLLAEAQLISRRFLPSADLSLREIP